MPRIQSLSSMVLIAMATPVAAQQTGHVDSLARLRAGPGDEYRLVGEAEAGNPVTVYGCLESGRWWDVRGPDARGWIPAQAIVSGRGAVTKLVPKVTFALDAYWDALSGPGMDRRKRTCALAPAFARRCPEPGDDGAPSQ